MMKYLGIFFLSFVLGNKTQNAKEKNVHSKNSDIPLAHIKFVFAKDNLF